MTPSQESAVVGRGNLLVMAGAGTGKTSTLVQRCLHCLTDGEDRASLDEILMVTFTEAAAAEMQRRIREQLEKNVEAGSESFYWEEQLALFETANIGTLHSFCFKLVRQHFHELGLDPQLLVLPEEDAKLLEDETLEILLRENYGGESEFARQVQELIEVQGGGSDDLIRSRILGLHNYTQTLRDPAAWFDAQLAMYESTEPVEWREWLAKGLREWVAETLEHLRGIDAANTKALELISILETLPAEAATTDYGAALFAIAGASEVWPPRKKGEFEKPLKEIFKDAFFLYSLTRPDARFEPLRQDWDWVRGQMATLLQLTSEFGARFTAAKRELAGLDFHDLEQFALKLLIDPAGNPTPIAFEWRRKLKHVFVDEYQDINGAQDAILAALGREGEEANRFLVGDVKQSIYRFRLADPRIFQRYMNEWRGGAGMSIALSDNFRSREGILGFVNAIFPALMRRELGGVEYGAEAMLKFGNAEERRKIGLGHGTGPRVELHLRVKGQQSTVANGEDETDGRESNDWENMEEAGKEACLAASLLKKMKNEGHPIWDGDKKIMRAVEWGDMAVLMRAPKAKMEAFAREFSRMDVPLTIARAASMKALKWPICSVFCKYWTTPCKMCQCSRYCVRRWSA